MDLENGHIRQDKLTQQWVIYAPERGNRPRQMKSPKPKAAEGQPEKDSTCPFCPGNEQFLPEITFESQPEGTNLWLTRAVLNKYPAMTPDKTIVQEKAGIYLTTTAFGKHEVIIETPFHNRDIPMMSTEQVENIIATYIHRHSFFYDNYEDIRSVIIFRNHGASSGTSLIHPHSQIVGTAIIPRHIRDKEKISENYFNDNDHCLLCDIIDFEMHQAVRSVYENDSFFAFVPFASEVPFEVWIVPKRHCANFPDILSNERLDLAKAIKNILSRLFTALDDPDYNYVIYSCSRAGCSSSYLHWYMQIRPRTTTPAGFEIGSGVHINPSLPEKDAEFLR